jgi:hypothetical protein
MPNKMMSALCCGLLLAPQILAQTASDAPSRDLLLFLASMSAEESELMELAQACEDAPSHATDSPAVEQSSSFCPDASTGAAAVRATDHTQSPPKIDHP